MVSKQRRSGFRGERRSSRKDGGGNAEEAGEGVCSSEEVESEERGECSRREDGDKAEEAERSRRGCVKQRRSSKRRM